MRPCSCFCTFDYVFQIVFLAVSNPNNATLSDELHAIAIDNLRHIPLTEGNACVRRPTDDMNPPSPTSSAVSLYSNNSVIQSCNFNDNCGFVMQSSGITWQIRDLEAVHGNFRIPERPEGGEGTPFSLRWPIVLADYMYRRFNAYRQIAQPELMRGLFIDCRILDTVGSGTQGTRFCVEWDFSYSVRLTVLAQLEF